MIERFGVFLAIILHTTFFIHVHALPKDDLTLATDTREPISSAPRLSPSLENPWLKKNEQSRYHQDDVVDTDGYSRSKLLSSLMGDFKGVENPPHPQIKSSRQLQSRDGRSYFEHAHWELEHDEEDDEDGEEIREQYDDLDVEDEEEDDRKRYDEEYERDQHVKEQKSEVHLFGPSGMQLRENVKLSQDQLNPNTKNANHKILRVDRPEADTDNFSYIHPEEWSLNNPECSGRLQSPVNFDSDQLIGLDVPTRLIWTGYWNRAQNLTIIDNGHSVELSGTWDKETAPFISGGPLVGDYLFAQLHFHWGPKDSVGSEHTINNKRFPMEMHMVHYKKDYGTLQEALKYDDGLAVVAFLFEIGETSNYGINLLEDSLSRIQNKPRVKVPVKPYPLALLHFIFQEDYASYIGSLTTPPCREIVTWLVSSSPLTVSRKQLESFRKISHKWPVEENYRPRQALNGRHLYFVAH